MVTIAALALLWLWLTIGDAIDDAHAVLSPLVRRIMAACIAARTDTVI